ncbi:hypothetical protein A2U01_0089642, partial [Trifolium medium]|nr:hypothetical protein [Trifolium medium]
GRSTAVGSAVIVVFAYLRLRCSASGVQIWFRVIAALASSPVVIDGVSDLAVAALFRTAALCL